MIGLIRAVVSLTAALVLAVTGPASLGRAEFGTGPIPGSGPGTMSVFHVEDGAHYRTARVSEPLGTPPEDGWPVVLAFHGRGGSSLAMSSYARLETAAAIVVYLDGLGGVWQGAPYAPPNDGSDTRFVRAVLARVGDTWPLDASRVYAVGFSNGGGFVGFLRCRMGEALAGVAYVAAAHYRGALSACGEGPVPTIVLHGTRDRIMSDRGGSRNGRQYLAVNEVLDAAARRNRCPDHTAAHIFRGVQVTRYLDCAAPLEYHRVSGGDHVWFGSANDKNPATSPGYATTEIMRFFGIESPASLPPG